MHDIPTPEEIKAAADAAGLTVPELSRRAQTAPSTFYRWLNRQHEPSGAIIQKWVNVVRAAVPQDGAQPDPTAVAVLTEHGRFVLAHGPEPK